MGFKMKGSPAKLGTIQGTSGHRSALKMAAEAEAAQNSPVPIIGAVSKIAKGVGKVAGKVKGAVDKVKGAFSEGKAEGIAGPAKPESPAKLDTKSGRAPRKTEWQKKEEAKKKFQAIEGGGKWEGEGGGLKVDKKRRKPSKEANIKKTQMMKRGTGLKKQSLEELAKQQAKRKSERMTKAITGEGKSTPKRGGGLKKQSLEELAAQKAKRKAKRKFKAITGEGKYEGKGGGLKVDKKGTPNKWLLTAAKAVGKGLMGRSKQKDARDAEIHKGVSSAMGRPIQ